MRSTAGRTPSPGLLRLRAAGNALNLSTLVGLAVAALGGATVERGPRGLFLAEGYRLSFPRAGAFTIGNVIVTPGRWSELDERFPKLLVHEEAHTWQYLYCLGMPYYLAYSACMGWSMLRHGDRASGNFFERRAGLAFGGYAEQPTRSLLAAAAVRRDARRGQTSRSMPSRLAERLRCRLARRRRSRLTSKGS